jgi:hypothetical protein
VEAPGSPDKGRPAQAGDGYDSVVNELAARGRKTGWGRRGWALSLTSPVYEGCSLNVGDFAREPGGCRGGVRQSPDELHYSRDHRDGSPSGGPHCPALGRRLGGLGPSPPGLGGASPGEWPPSPGQRWEAGAPGAGRPGGGSFSPGGGTPPGGSVCEASGPRCVSWRLGNDSSGLGDAPGLGGGLCPWLGSFGPALPSEGPGLGSGRCRGGRAVGLRGEPVKHRGRPGMDAGRS